MTIEKVSFYKVANGKITKGEFSYDMEGQTLVSSSLLGILRIHCVGLPRLVVLVLLAVTLLVAPGAEAQTFEEASTAYERGDNAVVIELLRILAEQGDAGAQYNLGIISSEGDGVPQKFTKTEQGVVFVISVILIILLINIRRWSTITIRRAANQGDAEAQCNLGVMYDEGQGVPEDAGEAVRWFRQAAEQGLAEAQWNLGLMYAQGRGAPEDAGEAVRWYRQAAEQGHAEAQYKLGVMYEAGLKLPNIVAVSPTQYKLVCAEGRRMLGRRCGGGGRRRNKATPRLSGGYDYEGSSKMTPDQIAEAQRLAREWEPAQ